MYCLVFIHHSKYLFQNVRLISKYPHLSFPDVNECPPNGSPGRSYREETSFSNYRGSEDESQEPSSPSGDYSGSHSSKSAPSRFQKQPQHQHQQQQVSAS